MFAFVGASLLLHAQTRGDAGKSNSAVIFCVSSDGATDVLLDPIVITGQGRFREIEGGADSAQFRSKYYRLNERYRLIFGGATVGGVKITKTEAAECLPTGADGQMQSSVRLGGSVMALATDAGRMGGAANARRAPTNDERATVLNLVRSEFLRRGTPAASLEGITIENLTAFDLNRDGKHELIGSFAINRARPFLVRQLFVIGEPQPKANYRLALARYDSFTEQNMMGELSIEEIGKNAVLTEMLIDGLDTDGDGRDEVFTKSVSFEGTHYAIYRRRARGWQRVYETYNYRCGY